MSGLVRTLLLGIVVLAGTTSPARATMLWNGGGASITANSCDPGDFATGIGVDGTLTCSTAAVGDITAVGDCTSGDCFTATSGNSSLIFEGSTADTSETTLTVTDPTADRTVTLPNLSGTVAIERVYDVRAYGAQCDDSTDDTAAIQAAIDAAEAARGGIVMLPANICKVTNLTIDAPGVVLRGQGRGVSSKPTVLSCNITTGSCVSFGASCTSGCAVEKLIASTRSAPTDAVIFDATAASAGGTSALEINLVGARYCVGFSNMANVQDVALFYPIAGAGCRGVSIVDTGAYLREVKGNWSTDIDGMIVIEQTGSNIVDTVIASDLEIAQSGGAGAALKIIAASATTPPRWIHISNSFFEAKTTGATTGDYPIYIGNVRDFECVNCYAQGGYRGVVVEGGPGPVVFTGGSIGNTQREAVYHDADVITSLIGTTVSDASLATDNTYSDVYLSTNSRGFSMVGGTVGAELLGFPGNDPKYGIEVASGADEYRFADVVCTDVPDSGCASGLTPAAAQAAFTDATAYADSDWSNYVLLRAPGTVAANWTLTLPTTDGATNDLLCNTDGGGTTDWCSEVNRAVIPAASADCSASNWAKGIDADLVLDCSQPALTDLSDGDLAQGSIWQGNASGATTAYSNPIGRDIRTYGAACDGSTDDSQQIQDAVDAAAASGGTVYIPNTGSACMIGNETTNNYVELKDDVSIVCAPGAEIKALTGGSTPDALFKSTGTGASSVDRWRITGCGFNLDQLSVPAVYVEEGTDFSFDHNRVKFNGDGDTIATNTTAFDIVHLDCKVADTSPPPFEGRCTVAMNYIEGSGTDTQNDTCLSVYGGAGLLNIGDGMIVTANHLEMCGGNGLSQTGGAIAATVNQIGAVEDYGIYAAGGQSNYTGNIVQVDGAEENFYSPATSTSGSNLFVIGNTFTAFGSGAAVRVRATTSSSAGIWVANNYAAKGIHFDAAGTCTGGADAGEECDSGATCDSATCGSYRDFNHISIMNNVISTAGARNGIVIENGQGLIKIGDNTDVTSTSSTYSSIELQSLDSVQKGGFSITGNNLAPSGAGTRTCIEIDHAGGGALDGVEIAGNVCGGETSAGTGVTVSKGIEVTGTPTMTNVVLAANNLGNATTPYTGFMVDGVVTTSFDLRVDDMYPDAAQCTANAAAQINSGPILPSIDCTDNAASAFYFQWKPPLGWDAGAVRVTYFGVDTDATPDEVYDFDFACMCRSTDDTIDNTWGTAQNAVLTFTNQYRLEQATTAAMTCNGTCAVGDVVVFRALMDSAASSGTTPTTVRLLGARVDFLKARGD